MINPDERRKFYNEALSRIDNALLDLRDTLGREAVLEALADMVKEEDMEFVGELVRKGYEPSITPTSLWEDNGYSEGTEESGNINLRAALNFCEEFLSAGDNEHKISFTHFVRPETKEEIEEKGHDDGVIWFVEDGRMKVDDLLIEFDTE